MQSRILYQILTQPVPVPPVTLDKYHQPFSDPVRRGGLITACIVASGLTAVLGPVSGSGDIAYANTNSIVPHSRTLLYQSISEPVPAAINTVDKWFVQLAVPPKRLGYPAYEQAATFFVGSDTAKDARWFTPLSEPTRGKPTQQPDGPSLVYVPAVAETVTLDKWFTPLADAPRRKATVQPEGLSLVRSIAYTIVVSSTNTTVTHVRTVLYQSLADPVPVPVTAETVTLDKWFTPLAGAPARKPTVQPDAVSFIGSDTARDARWLSPLSEPTRRKLAIQQDALSFVGSDTARDARWLAPLSEPTRRKPTAQPDGLSFVGSDTARDARWFTPLSEPTRRKPTIQPDGLSLVSASPFAESVSIDKWQQPLSEPTRRKVATQPDALSFIGSDAARDARWFAPLSEPTRRKPIAEFPALSWSYFTPASTEVVTLDKYYAWLAEPVRIKIGLAAYEQPYLAFVQAEPFPEAVSVDRWLFPLSEPVRRKVATQPESFVYAPVTAETVTVDKWLAPLAGAPARKATTQPNSLSFVGSDTSRDARWFTSLSEPTRRKPTVQPDGLSLAQAAPFAETVSIDRWQQPLSEPVRLRGTTAAQQQAFFFVGSDTARDARWFAPLSEPTRRQPLAEFPALSWSQFTTASTEVVTVDKYYAWFAEPVRIKIGLAVYEQPYLAFVQAAPFAETVSIDRWLVDLSQPTRLPVSVASVPSLSWNGFTPADVIVTRPSDGHGGWKKQPRVHVWVERPIRLLVQPDVRLDVDAGAVTLDAPAHLSATAEIVVGLSIAIHIDTAIAPAAAADIKAFVRYDDDDEVLAAISFLMSQQE